MNLSIYLVGLFLQSYSHEEPADLARRNHDIQVYRETNMHVKVNSVRKAITKLELRITKKLCCIPITTLLVLVCLWSLTLYRNYDLEKNAKRDAYKHVELINQRLAEHEEKMLASRDSIARTISFLVSQKIPQQLLHQFLSKTYGSKEKTPKVVITDKLGNVVAPDMFKEVSIIDREHFIFHMTNVKDEIYISSPIISRITNKETVVLTRRLVDSAGEFSGIVAVDIVPDEFISHHEQAQAGTYGFSGVISEDGRSQYAAFGKSYMPKLTSRTAFIYDQPSGQRSLNGSFFSDGRSRLVAWSKIQGYPLIAVSGVDTSEELAATRALQKEHTQTASYISLSALLVMFFGTTLHALTIRNKRQEEVAKDAYRVAVDVARDGFMVLEAVRNNNNEIDDFRCVDFNAQAALLLGAKDSDMRTMKLTEMFPSTMAQRLVSSYVNIMLSKDKLSRSSVFIPYEGPLQNKWIDYRIVPYENGVAVTMLDVTSEKNSHDAIEWQKVHDQATSLSNRAGFLIQLPDRLANALDKNEAIALFVIDLDDFKIVNDTLGHAIGDQLLKMVGERLISISRNDDLLCRLGADEFALAIQGKFDNAALGDFALRILQKLNQPFYLNGKSVIVGASVGISMAPEQCIDAQQLLKYADLAMISAKESGKSTYRFFEKDLYTKADRRLSVEQDLRLALERDELFLVYQPKIDLAHEVIVGMEALIRWNSPTRGLVSPLEFIEIAEKTGLIIPIGNFVIQQACRQIRAWRAAGFSVKPVSVNISPKQLYKGDLVDILRAEMLKYDIPPNLLQVELTESSMMDDVEFSKVQLQAIKALGIKILVDDFGTGYSSLALLKKFEIDVLKVDRSFVKDLPGDSEGCAILQAIVSMANALHMEVVAEGVETAEQVIFLQNQGCESCQGFFYSKPISAVEMQKWLKV